MIKHSANSKSGVVLPVVIMLIFCGFIIAAMLAIHAGNSLGLTRRSIEYHRASILADSGIGYGLMYVKSEISKLGWARFLSAYRNKVNTLVNDNSDEDDKVDVLPNYNREYRNGVCFQIVKENMRASASEEGGIEVVIYSVSRNEASGIASAIKETISMTISQLGDYAAFYEYDLEAWPGENMTFVGKVHSNGDLWIGADKLMKFERNVTAAGNFYAQRKPDSGYGNTAYVSQSGRVQFRKGDDGDYDNGATKPDSYADVINTAKNNKRMDYTGIGADNWYSQSMSYYGGAIKTGQSKLSAPISVADDPHTIIEPRKEVGQPGYNAETEAVKFANKASLTIRIDSEGGLHLYDHKHVEIENPESLMQPAASVAKASTSTGQYRVTQGTYTYVDDNNQSHSSQLPAYEVDNYIYDRRDDVARQPVDVYIDEILNSEALKKYLYPSDIAEDEIAEAGVLYITRDEPQGYPVVEKIGERDIIGPVTNKITKTSTELEAGWEKVGTSTVPLFTVKKPRTYYYYTGTRTKSYQTQTSYRGTSYKSNNKTYTYDATKTKNEGGSTNVATGKTESEAAEIMSGHADYYTTRESGTKTVYNLQKIEVTQGKIGTEDLFSTNYIPTQPCVRLRNANNLSLAGSDAKGKRGLSIATDLPLYVEGCFNTDGQKGKAGDNCETHPSALVAADAVTMLSSNWDDGKRVPWWEKWNSKTGQTSLRPDENKYGKNQRVAVETTFNGILMTGIVESNGGTYSGGLQNLFRFHENWRPSGTIPYNFNGSMVCMWLSKIAKNPIEGSYTYEPPSRPWGWAKMTPPGLPNIMNIQEFEWRRIDTSEYPDENY